MQSTRNSNGGTNNLPCYPPDDHQSHNALYRRTERSPSLRSYHVVCRKVPTKKVALILMFLSLIQLL